MKTFKDTMFADFIGNRYENDVDISSEDVTSLKGSPEFVGGSFDCSYCYKLESLKYSPRVVKGDFNCNNCKNLETLEGTPKKCKTFKCKGCPKLKNLDPLLQCDIEEVVADERLLDEYKMKKDAVNKYGYDKAMEVFSVLGDLE